MEESTHDLIRQLCARAGMIMEDASLLAVTMPAGRTDTVATSLAQLQRDAQGIARLVAAAAELAGRDWD